MLRYITKRLLVFIPTFFIISLLIFGLSKMAPGDPVLILLQGGMEQAEGGQRTDLIASEEAYARQAAQLGLDRPSFYFNISSLAYPSDLHKIQKAEHRELIRRLIDQSGNADLTLKYYEQIKKAQILLMDIPNEDYQRFKPLYSYINDLFLSYENSRIEFLLTESLQHLDQIDQHNTPIRKAFVQLEKNYKLLLLQPTTYKLYIPSIHWYGLHNQYHTWMFGDYPWFSSVDSSIQKNIQTITTELKELSPKRQRLDRKIRLLKAQLHKKQQDSSLVAQNPELCKDIAQQNMRLSQTQSEYLGLQKRSKLLFHQRDSLRKASPVYASYGLLRGDFGKSYINGMPVRSKIKSFLFWTLIMNFFAILLSYFIAIPLGVKSAQWKSKAKLRKDNSLTAILFMLYSLPSFWIGTLLLIFLTTPEYGAFLDLFPSGGAQDINILQDPNASTTTVFLDIAHHLVLPIFCMTYASLAFLSRQMRGAMLNSIQQDYIRTARSKGLAENKVFWKHAFRNSLSPIITLFASVFPRAVGGSIAIEVIYNIPGMGTLFYDSIPSRDWPVIFSIVMLAAVMTIIGNLIADILYALSDPRISFK